MTSDKVGRIQAHLDRLDDKLSRRLTERVAAQTAVEPYTRPPRPIRLVVLEFTRQEYGNKDLEDTALDGDDGDEAEDGVGGVPAFEEPLRSQFPSRSGSQRQSTGYQGNKGLMEGNRRTYEELEEGQHTNHRTKVRHRRHGRTKLIRLGIELYISYTPPSSLNGPSSESWTPLG